MLRLIRLDPKNAECWSHLPLVRASIAEAGVHFKQKSCAIWIDRIVANFTAESLEGYHLLPKEQQQAQNTAVWYIWDDASESLRGHLVALQSEWDGEAAIYVYQLWVQRKWGGARSPEFVALQDTAAVELDHYARARGVTDLMMYTIRPSRFWAKRFGFTMRRFMYVHAVTP